MRILLVLLMLTPLENVGDNDDGYYRPPFFLRKGVVGPYMQSDAARWNSLTV